MTRQHHADCYLASYRNYIIQFIFSSFFFLSRYKLLRRTGRRAGAAAEESEAATTGASLHPRLARTHTVSWVGGAHCCVRCPVSSQLQVQVRQQHHLDRSTPTSPIYPPGRTTPPTVATACTTL